MENQSSNPPDETYGERDNLLEHGRRPLPGNLSNLAGRLYMRYLEDGVHNDLNNAIWALEAAIQMTPEEDGSLPTFLDNLGIISKSRYEHTSALPDLDTVISAQRRAVQLTKDGDPNLPLRWSNLAASLRDRFEHTAELRDVESAVSAFRSAVDAAPNAHPDLPSLLSQLGNTLGICFEHSGHLTDADGAISAFRGAIDIFPSGHINRAILLTSIGNIFHSRFERSGNLVDLDESVSSFDRAAGAFPRDHPKRSALLNGIAGSRLSRFERTKNVEDLSKAISLLQEAVELTSELEDQEDLPLMLTNLGQSLSVRFDLAGNNHDLSEAISAVKKAVQATPESHFRSQLPARLNVLGILLLRRYQREAALEHIEEALKVSQRAVQLTPLDHTDFPTRLSNLGNAYQSRFQRTGDPSDIAQAISVQQRSLLLAPVDHPEKAAWLNNIGNSFILRFRSGGVTSDRDEAIAFLRTSVELTPSTHYELPIRLTNFANVLLERFEDNGGTGDIDEAILVQQRSVNLTSDGHNDAHYRFGSLGSIFQARFESSRNPFDLAEAISAKQKAVALSQGNPTDLSIWLQNLGVALHSRFDLNGDAADLDQAILSKQNSVKLTPDHHTELSSRQLTLAHSLLARSISAQNQDDMKASISTYKSAATNILGRPLVRLAAAKHWASLLDQHTSQSLEIVAAYDFAVDLMTSIVSFGDTVQRRHTRLQGLSNIALEAAAYALRSNLLEKALEWLEQGRCMVWSQLNNLNMPLDDLRSQDSALAERVADVSRRLENSGSARALDPAHMTLVEKLLLEDQARERVRLAKEWDHLLATVRSRPGLGDFLKPTPCPTMLQQLPTSGSVVVVNISKDRCDAIALRAGCAPIHIPLPRFSLDRAKQYRHDLQAQLQSKRVLMRGDEERGGPQQRPIGAKVQNTSGFALRDVLRGVWDDVVKPILEKLGFTSAASDTEAALPRVWWCPTGPISFLPLHAAGIYTARGSESTYDYVVSSYTPTIAALTKRVQNSCQIDQSVSGLFLTSHAYAIPDKPISGTVEEVKSICASAGERVDRVLHLDDGDLNVEACLNAMERFSSVHLACHASQDAWIPLLSRFRLSKGSLELGSIIRRNFTNADLAFLSACQTSTGEEMLADEAVHLAAGMLAAGYRRVVATMWSIKDKYASKLANDLYRHIWTLQDGDSGGFDGSHSARALHHAIQQLRHSLDTSEDSLLAWVPYVHFGY